MNSTFMQPGTYPSSSHQATSQAIALPRSGMSDRDALHNRRAMYERLVAARDSATDADRAELDDAVARCGVKLDAATAASRSALKSAKKRRNALAHAVPSPSPSNQYYAVLHPALATRGRLRKAAQSLKRELRGAKRAKYCLDETTDALARAAALVTVLENSQVRSRNTWRSLLGADTDASTLHAHWCTAARGVSDARAFSSLAKQIIPSTFVQTILQGAHSNFAANNLRSIVDGCRETLTGFLQKACEQLTQLSGALAAAEEFVLAIRELIVKQSGIIVSGTPCTLTKHAKEKALNALQTISSSRTTIDTTATTTTDSTSRTPLRVI